MIATNDPTDAVRLCPAQQRAFDELLRAFPVGDVFVIRADGGNGRSTVMRAAQAKLGGTLITIKQLADSMPAKHPLAIEETFYELVLNALKCDDLVLVDDLHKVTRLSHHCHAYPRSGWFDAPLLALVTYAQESGKKLIFADEGYTPDAIRDRCYFHHISDFKPADYESLCYTFLGEELAARLDYFKIHRFAPKLDAHQIRAACLWLKDDEKLDTLRFVEYLRSQRMASNVDLEEVQAVDLRELKGVDDVIAALEANIIVPLENDKLAEQLNIRPKRGVLLAGPPGTGKTTIGRALAHRLKGKFFLIDGTFISGTHQFYGRVHQVFEAAKQNSPSVIFIDDSDVIFENGEEAGLYRYLLTMLDGLESESAARVCVMMTAMDVASLPPALVRSGRVELWLETRLPDEPARRSILTTQMKALPAEMGGADVAALASATDGLTGADLKRLIDDGKILYAYDKANNRPTRTATEYFVASIETVRANKARYAVAEAHARRQRPGRPPWFDVAEMMGSANVHITDVRADG
jgi:SpoVK/Ycf46/Vps4 family AAA+-type ATPase